ncbi:MAG: DUF503 domain-containing protein [Anaerolineaceae bacterium]
MPVGILVIHLALPGCTSLKDKRGRLAPILHQVHKKFNVSISETALQDVWQNACLSCAIISNEKIHIEQSFQNLLKFVESHWPDETIIRNDIEIY